MRYALAAWLCCCLPVAAQTFTLRMGDAYKYQCVEENNEDACYPDTRCYLDLESLDGKYAVRLRVTNSNEVFSGPHQVAGVYWDDILWKLEYDPNRAGAPLDVDLEYQDTMGGLWKKHSTLNSETIPIPNNTLLTLDSTCFYCHYENNGDVRIYVGLEVDAADTMGVDGRLTYTIKDQSDNVLQSETDWTVTNTSKRRAKFLESIVYDGINGYATTGYKVEFKIYHGSGTTPEDSITTSIIQPALRADFNFDKVVDGDDQLIWQANFPTSSGATVLTGDADGDGDVDGADYAIWQQEFGSSIGTVVQVWEETLNKIRKALVNP